MEEFWKVQLALSVTLQILERVIMITRSAVHGSSEPTLARLVKLSVNLFKTRATWFCACGQYSVVLPRFCGLPSRSSTSRTVPPATSISCRSTMARLPPLTWLGNTAALAPQPNSSALIILYTSGSDPIIQSVDAASPSPGNPRHQVNKECP